MKYLLLIFLLSQISFADPLDVACWAGCKDNPKQIAYRINMFGKCECLSDASEPEEDVDFYNKVEEEISELQNNNLEIYTKEE